MFEEVEVLELVSLGEFDVELDVEVAVVVVAEGGHALAWYGFDDAWKEKRDC